MEMLVHACPLLFIVIINKLPSTCYVPLFVGLKSVHLCVSWHFGRWWGFFSRVWWASTSQKRWKRRWKYTPKVISSCLLETQAWCWQCDLEKISEEKEYGDGGDFAAKEIKNEAETFIAETFWIQIHKMVLLDDSIQLQDKWNDVVDARGYHSSYNCNCNDINGKNNACWGLSLDVYGSCKQQLLLIWADKYVAEQPTFNICFMNIKKLVCTYQHQHQVVVLPVSLWVKYRVWKVQLSKKNAFDVSQKGRSVSVTIFYFGKR